MPPTQTQSTELDELNVTAIEDLGRLLQRHNRGDSENDIRTAFRDLILHTGIIGDESEIKTEVPPATDSIKRVDMYTRNTYIEFKTNIVSSKSLCSDCCCSGPQKRVKHCITLISGH